VVWPSRRLRSLFPSRSKRDCREVEPALVNWKHLDIAVAAQREWDVVVVGAGPGGSMAALHLARRGHRTLLLDKDPFPRDKVCGDALIPDTIRSLKRSGLHAEVCGRALQASISSFYSPSRIEYDVRGEFLTLKRIELDALMARGAVAAGATFSRAKVTNLSVQPDGTLLLATESTQPLLSARVALIATGANVEMPSRLGLVTQHGPSAIALRCYVRSSVHLDRLVISYDRSITPGYAWIFPLANGEFNIGCGITYTKQSSSPINLRETFRSFTTSFPLAVEIMRCAEAMSPLRGAMLRCGLTGTRSQGPGNVLVLGESIGATFPLTGEGIGKAMETGELAADVVHDALASDDMRRLRDFPLRIEHELKPKFLGYRIAENWFSRPWLNDFVARRISRSRFLQELVAGILNETVDPREVFSLRGILRSFVS
jgi:geranylgeranyl reductase family protein